MSEAEIIKRIVKIVIEGGKANYGLYVSVGVSFYKKGLFLQIAVEGDDDIANIPGTLRKAFVKRDYSAVYWTDLLIPELEKAAEKYASVPKIHSKIILKIKYLEQCRDTYLMSLRKCA